MKLLYLMVLLIFGAIPDDGCNKAVYQMGEGNITCNVRNCESAEMIAFIPNMDVKRRKNLQQMCEEKYIRAEKYYIDLLINVTFEGPNATYEYENFIMTVVNMMNPIDDSHVKISAPKLSEDDPPINVFILTKPFLNVTVNQSKVAIVTYPRAQQFTNDSNILLRSKVIRIKSVGCEIKDLSDQIVINFPLNSSKEIDGSYNLSCRFYDETTNRWSDMGSFTNLENNTVNCSYNHMSLFAVFLVPMKQQQENLPCSDDTDENYIFFNSTELTFQKNHSTSLCTWGEDRCYVECSSVNLTTDITGVINITNLALNSTITGHRKTQLVFCKGEKIITCNITKCNSYEMNTSINTMDFTRLIKAQDMCNKSFSADIYLEKEKEFIDQQINSTFNESNITKNYTNFKMTVFNISMLNPVDGSVKISAPKWSDQDQPIDVFFPTESSTNDSLVAVVRYGTAEKFNNNSNTVLMSQIVRVETIGSGRKDLTKLLFIKFPVNSTKINLVNSKLSCMFYDEKEHKWSDTGSFTNLENSNSSNTVNCSYNHMTPFAVFLVPMKQQHENLPCSDDTDENFIFFNSTELTFQKNHSTSLCTWGKDRCYVECSSVNLTTDITGVINITNLALNSTITGQHETQLVFWKGEKIITFNITKCNSYEMNTSINTMDFTRLIKAQDMCNKSFSAEIYFEKEKEFIDQQINSTFNESSITINVTIFKMTVFNISMLNPVDGSVKISAPKWSDQDQPIDVFFPTESTNYSRVAVVRYGTAEKFNNNSNMVLMSQIVRVETIGSGRKLLTKLLFIKFPVNSTKINLVNSTLSCMFYDEKEHKWSDTGSFTNLENSNSSNTVNCSYNHMTPFAVFLVPMKLQQENLPCSDDTDENCIFFNSTELTFQKNHSTSLCTWGEDRCYVECSSVNLTTDITGVINITNLTLNSTITGQHETQLVFWKGEKIITFNITKCNSYEMNTSINTMDFTRLIKAQDMCNKSFSADIYFEKEKEFIDQQINSTFNESSITINVTIFKMTVFNISMLNPVDGSVKISAPKWSDQDQAIDVFFPTESSTNNSLVTVVRYGTAEKFNNNSNTVLMSQIVRVETIGSGRKDLTKLLFIKFPVNSTKINLVNSKLSCMFYDEKEHKWSDTGSFTNLENSNSSNTVNCSYNHMTPFAVFLVPMKLQHENLPCSDDTDENYIFFNSTELTFQKNHSTSLCTWGEDRCYVECSSVNLTTDITGVINITNLTLNSTITGQRKTQLVFCKGEKIITCNITKCNSYEMNTSINTMDFTRLINAQDMCNKSFSADIYFKKEKEFIDQQINSTFNESNITKNYTNFKMTVFNISMLNPVDGSVKISAPKWSDQDQPIEVFFPTESSTNYSLVAVVRYGTAEKFNNNSNTVLMSQIVRVETIGSGRKDLTKLLFIKFPVNSTKINLENSNRSCMFYDEKEHKWSDTGSFTNLENFSSSNTVNCSYNHMTPFAVFNVGKQQQNLSCRNYSDNRTKNFFIYNNSGLDIEENLTKLLCTWDNNQCYVDCSFVNLSTNLMDLNNVTYEVQNYTITPQRIKLVFKISALGEITCNVTQCKPGEIGPLFMNLSSSNNLKDLKKIAQVKQMCEQLLASDSSLIYAYIRAEKKYIEFLINSKFNGTSKNYDLKELNMTVVKMDMINTTDLKLVQISAPKVPNNKFPVEIFVPTEPFQNVPTEQCKIGIVTYPSASHFMNGVSQNFTIKVIRVEVNGRVLKDLSNRLVINFTLNYSEIIPENYTLSCQFYDENVYKWADTGSFTDLENFNSSGTVSCSYDHMTPFAVLLTNPKLDSKQWKIMSSISYIGCSFSAFFSAVTIFLYTFTKSSNKDTSIHIHVSLSAAVFLLNISFLFTEWGATWSQKSACVFIAVIVEYSLLSCFSWMAIEALHLYFLLIKVFNTYIKHYMIKLSLFGWGMPALLVGGSLCAYGKASFYGTTQITLSDTNEAMQFCWITDIRFLYGMNITYFSIMFLFNMSILVAVICQICKLRRMNVRGSRFLSRKDICTVLGLTFLLGMTWGLAFFASGYTNYTVLYLFCIFNTLQGLFLFLWFYATMKKKRRLLAQSSTMSDPSSAPIKTMESSFSH
ncbi:uncharacterized protein LOC113646696 isoform X7 [Tachysurus fulvidraco]|uniref:uncharacterized protein LOC113646696 isoform X7 n=1 Tax=Tachysurus fulvidraco TaxID=1234273 RepID=UPI001FEE6A9D|nr:uncharacterized protein LOC113646696 isoform X7 [Tachysurus fulvidraco]